MFVTFLVALVLYVIPCVGSILLQKIEFKLRGKRTDDLVIALVPLANWVSCIVTSWAILMAALNNKNLNFVYRIGAAINQWIEKK